MSGSPGPLRGHTTGLRLVGECLMLIVLKDPTLGGSSHFQTAKFMDGSHNRVQRYNHLKYIFFF
jgi:hypothetical protein